MKFYNLWIKSFNKSKKPYLSGGKLDPRFWEAWVFSIKNPRFPRDTNSKFQILFRASQTKILKIHPLFNALQAKNLKFTIEKIQNFQNKKIQIFFKEIFLSLFYTGWKPWVKSLGFQNYPSFPADQASPPLKYNKYTIFNF